MTGSKAKTSAEERSLINLRVTAHDRRLIDRAAAMTGKNRSEFMLEAARSAAEEAVLDKALFHVNAKQMGELLKFLDTPASANPRLKKLMRTKAPWEA